MGSHERTIRGETNEWLTPPYIIEALGPFDLDPCSPVGRPWDTAAKHYTIEDDGLAQEWDGLVWCNPPYGPDTEVWLARLAAHGNGLALIFARTETKWFQRTVWERADAVLFLDGRLRFHRVDGTEEKKSNAGAPSCIVGYGELAVARIRACGLAGRFVSNWE